MRSNPNVKIIDLEQHIPSSARTSRHNEERKKLTAEKESPSYDNLLLSTPVQAKDAARMPKLAESRMRSPKYRERSPPYKKKKQTQRQDSTDTSSISKEKRKGNERSKLMRKRDENESS